MKDQYILLFENGFYHFYKNKVLHREVGPAFFHEEYKDEYLNLGDESLYQLSNETTDITTNLCLQYLGEVSYYIEGNYCEEEQFEKLILNKQLNEDLSNINNNNKKVKI
jgi:hypothetical protein